MSLLLAGSGACSGDVADPGPVVVIVQQPTQAVVNELLVPSLEVLIEDASGRPATGEITVAIDPNPCEWPLLGTTTMQAADGRAIFEDLRFGGVANGYRLAVRSGSTQALSEPIDVTAQAMPGHALVLETTLCPKPNDQRDAESLEYVRESDSFWLADDDNPSIFEVDRTTGRTRSQLRADTFAVAFPAAANCIDNDNDPATSCSYIGEFEHVAYDERGGLLYVMNTVNNPVALPQKDRGAIFKLRRGGGRCPGCWGFESWQPLPDVSFDAMVTIDGSLYFALGRRLIEYDYATNTLLSVDANGDSLPPAYVAPNRIQRVQYDGSHLWVVVEPLLLRRVEWETRTEVASYSLAPSGIDSPKGVGIIGDRVYVLEGDPPNPIYVFRLTAAP